MYHSSLWFNPSAMLGTTVNPAAQDPTQGPTASNIGSSDPTFHAYTSGQANDDDPMFPGSE